MFTTMKELWHQNETMLDNIQDLQKQLQPTVNNQEDLMVSQPLAEEVCDAYVLDNFKLPSDVS